MTYVNGHRIRSKKDLEKVIALADAITRRRWKRPLSQAAIDALNAQFSFDEIDTKKETSGSIELTFAEKISGKSLAEIKAERKRRLEAGWERRKSRG